MDKKSRMYEVNDTRVRTWNPFVGCKFNCSYCYAPEIHKRFSKCEQCKAFTPHFHPERSQQKFKAGETVFVCSMSDISFASCNEFASILGVIKAFPETTFYIQSKRPDCFHKKFKNTIPGLNMFLFPNVVIGTTIETNKDEYMDSYAPYTDMRKVWMEDYFMHPRKYITIEPIFDFDLDILITWLKQIAPEFVYVGYLNPEWKVKKLQIPEPPLQKTLELIEELKKFTEVRLKTIRKAWNEER